MKRFLILAAMFVFSKAHSQDLEYLKYVNERVKKSQETYANNAYLVFSETKAAKDKKDPTVEGKDVLVTSFDQIPDIIVYTKYDPKNEASGLQEIYYYYVGDLAYFTKKEAGKITETYFIGKDAYQTTDKKTYVKVEGMATYTKSKELMSWFSALNNDQKKKLLGL